MYYIYILYSPSVDKYYVGHTDNVKRRVVEHNESDRITYTSKSRPWILKAVFKCSEDRGKTMKLEHYIKKLKNRKIIEKLIDGGVMSGKLAQLVRVPQLRD